MRVRSRIAPAILAALLTSASPLAAQLADTLRVRIVDVGAGLCTIARVPGGGVMVYDAGHWQGARCITAVRSLVPGGNIDLLVVSHSDSDHLGDVPEILSEYRVRQVIWTGFRRPDTGTWREANEAIAAEVRDQGASVRSLSSQPLVSGETISLGRATVTLLGGWSDWPPEGLTESERRNVVSIVLRLDYGSSSIVYGGDTVGRRIGDPADACKDAEAWMVGPLGVGVSALQADVLIAPHHGADNASSHCFIDAVDPTWVVFSAGHDFAHPRATTAARYIAHGIPAANLLRTDRGDDEGSLEWTRGRVSGCSDARGDDDIEVKLLQGGFARAVYVRAAGGC